MRISIVKIHGIIIVQINIINNYIQPYEFKKKTSVCRDLISTISI